MKRGRLWRIFVMVLLMTACAALHSAYALEADDWEGQWLKGKVFGRGYCDDAGKMERDKWKESIYIKIDSARRDQMEIFVLLKDDGGQWTYLPLTLEREMGDYDRGVFNTHFTLTDGGDTSEIYLGFLLGGRENKKTGELKKGYLKTICGAQIGNCTSSVSLTGKTIRENKVPQAVKDALPPP